MNTYSYRYFLAIAATFAFCLTGVAAARAAGASLADCNNTAFAQVLRPSPAGGSATARAVWLDRGWIRWPGIKPDGRFRLYASTDGQLSLDVHGRIPGADAALDLVVAKTAPPSALAERFKYVSEGVHLNIASADQSRLPTLLQSQLLLAHEDDTGRILASTAIQSAGVLDDLYADAESEPALGASIHAGATSLKLWAPTARAVSACFYATGSGKATALQAMQRDPNTGIWSATLPDDRSGQYYTYLVDVFVRGIGVVRNRVTDPYSISLTSDSRRSYIADLDSPALKPEGWEAAPRPTAAVSATDMSIYELHVRDFSINDPSVPSAHRGTYLAFTDANANGMQHLKALAQAGLTDLHLLPVFDFATVPESGCLSPRAVSEAADPAKDCFNWGYDPWHFGAPEGSYATDAADGATRVLEFRRMVMALHGIGLRVGMDVVYNHTSAAGQDAHSLLDRIVPGYYQRLDADGGVEHSTCCANTATENRMMAKLMVDTVARWARDYRVDSFRFDLMGHQPRAAMEMAKARVAAAAGRPIPMIGEGWNFGEIADGKRFVQASQLSLNGSGIGTFSDRARDAVRGGGAGDSGKAMLQEQGFINGLVYDPNASADRNRSVRDLEHAADLVRVGLAGSIRDYQIQLADGAVVPAEKVDYEGAPAGYVSQPEEVVNYVENHDNQTLFDVDALKLPRATTGDDRVRVQMLGAALVALSQGIAYYHAGIDTLRSKSLDRNSFDSGDWFNRLDWSYQSNYFGTGLPPKADNGRDYDLLKPFLDDKSIAPTPTQIAMARDMFRDLLRIRASSTLFRLRTAEDVKRRLRFYNTGTNSVPTVIAGHLEGKGYAGAGFQEVLYLVNVDKLAHTLAIPEERGKAYILHPVQASPNAADRRPATEARYDAATGSFTIPARSTVVYVVAASDLPEVASGRVVRLANFPSRFVAARNVDIWLPEGYSSKNKYAVVYMQDGQMLFDANKTWNHQEWRVDEVASKLIADGAARPFIVVGIWNGGASRHSEYTPQKPFESLDDAQKQALMTASTPAGPPMYNGPVVSDNYLKFMVSELKPYIDHHYSVAKGRDSTFLAGSSFGGLISLYALAEYPEVFGGAACLSTHWPVKYTLDDNPMPAAILVYLEQHLPPSSTHRIYFDRGTETLDKLYPDLQAKVDQLMRVKDYRPAQWQSLVFTNAAHEERAWAARLETPLRFLLAPEHPAVEELDFSATSLTAATLHTTIYLPPGYRQDVRKKYPVLYVNDGQDMPAVGMTDALADLQAQRRIPGLIVVAVHAPASRMDVYGFSDNRSARSVVGDSRFGPIGREAYAYSQWLATELVPKIDAQYRTCRAPASRAVLGWSLGAASAFDLGWNHPDLFGIVGAFSPSFWLATDRHDLASMQATRIAHAMVAGSRPPAGLRLWLAVGDAEEKDDRDGDGVSDAVDDVQDFLRDYRAAGGQRAEYLLLKDGQHNQTAWKQELPGFLAWAFNPDDAGIAACR